MPSVVIGFVGMTVLAPFLQDYFPVDQGRIAIETLNDICEGKEVKDVETACYWYDAETMEDAEIAPNLYD